MSTQFYTQVQPATSPRDTRRAPRPDRDGPSWYRIAALVIGAVAAAALIVLAATARPAATPQRPGARDTIPRPRPLPVGGRIARRQPRWR
jgi:hypothetical protein